VDTRNRKRGVKASRAKLEVAMLEAGVRTQAELSDKIAEHEGLAFPPKDTINRAFRQHFVSPATVARIAHILQVSPESLYLPEDNLPATEASTNGINQRQAAAGQAALGRLSVAILCLDDKVDIFINSLHQQISGSVQAITINPALLPDKCLSGDIARDYQADAVITVNASRQERFIGIQLYVYFESVEKLAWTGSTSISELRQQHQHFAQSCLPFLYHALGLATPPPHAFETIRAQQDYLQARVLINNYHSEINLKRAQGLLSTALKDNPDFARAHAALAETYIHESWQGDEKHLLEQAQASCDRAHQLAPQDSYINAIISFLYRRSGRSDEAIQLCQRTLKKYPDNTDLLSALANAYQVMQQHDPERYPDALTRACEYAEQATLIEPDNWRLFFDLGNAHYCHGAILPAIEAFEQAARLNPSESAFINLGTMYNCLGQINKALEYYTRAHALDPQSYLGNEYLGLVYYYLEDFDKSAQFKRRALDSFNQTETVGLHQMWGDLADAYRHTGKPQLAEQSYSKAIKIIERDTLRGNATLMDEIYQTYYLLTLHTLYPERYEAPQNLHSEQQIAHYLSSDLYPSCYVKLAQIQLLQENMEQARKALEKAAATCPLFIHHPDLKPLKALYFKDAHRLN